MRWTHSVLTVSVYSVAPKPKLKLVDAFKSPPVSSGQLLYLFCFVSTDIDPNTGSLTHSTMVAPKNASYWCHIADPCLEVGVTLNEGCWHLLTNFCSTRYTLGELCSFNVWQSMFKVTLDAPNISGSKLLKQFQSGANIVWDDGETKLVQNWIDQPVISASWCSLC